MYGEVNHSRVWRAQKLEGACLHSPLSPLLAIWASVSSSVQQRTPRAAWGLHGTASNLFNPTPGPWHAFCVSYYCHSHFDLIWQLLSTFNRKYLWSVIWAFLYSPRNYYCNTMQWLLLLRTLKPCNLLKYFSVLLVKILQFSSWIWNYLLKTKARQKQIIHFKNQSVSLVVWHYLPI